MMADAGGMPGLFAVTGALLASVLFAALPAAAQEGWEPLISRPAVKSYDPPPTSPSHALAKAARSIPATRVAPRPPVPHMKPAEAKSKPSAVSSVPEGTPIPVDGEDIITGSVDSFPSRAPLAIEDSARLFAESGGLTSSPITTGAVDGPSSDLAKSYCVAISSAAADARIAVQKAKLAEVEKQISQRIAALEAKTAEYKNWVDRRDEFLKRANNSLVKIYTQMEPDAAALQLVEMDEETAASLLLKLEPQNASAILNEMVPDKAARLAATISGAARLKRPTPQPAAAPQRPVEDGVPQPVQDRAYPDGRRS